MRAELVSKSDDSVKTEKDFELFDVVLSNTDHAYLVVEVDGVKRFVDTNDSAGSIFCIGRAEGPNYNLVPRAVTRLVITGDTE